MHFLLGSFKEAILFYKDFSKNLVVFLLLMIKIKMKKPK